MITGTGYRENNTRPDFRAGVVNHQLRARGNVGWGTEQLTEKKKSPSIPGYCIKLKKMIVMEKMDHILVVKLDAFTTGM